ncbi:hypothetical protein HDU91_007022 [Kappamyces sp. JEL0680]|nr:hypothetical protein HDU91_007022 [Kappamyces sp. JEL0680]
MSIHFLKPESIPLGIQIKSKKDIDSIAFPPSLLQNQFHLDKLAKTVEWEREQGIEELVPLVVTADAQAHSGNPEGSSKKTAKKKQGSKWN